MILYEILWRSSDTCGNSDRYHVGYCKFENQMEAQKAFPPGFLAGYEIREVPIEDVQTIKKRCGDGIKKGHYR